MLPNQKFGFEDKAECSVSRDPSLPYDAPNDGIKFRGRFERVELLRAKRDIFGDPIPGEFYEPEILTADNTATVVGINNILDVQFHSQTQITTWYGALVDNASFSAFSTADTMASHAGWIESIAFSEGTRVAWGAGTPSAGSITNASAMVFSINGTATIKGLFITSGSAKSGAAGILWATAAFSSTVSVTNGDSLRVTYTLSAS